MKKNGFTLVEMLVVMAVLSVASGLILTIFTRTLQGGNKTQIIEVMKQNGQAVLEVMDKNVRNSDRVVCVTNDTVTVVKDGAYSRFRFIAQTQSTNGYIQQDPFNLPSSPPTGSDPNLYVRDFETTLCTDPLSSSAQIITDTSSKTGISVINGMFTRDNAAGYKDQVVIKFSVKPGVGAPSALAGQIDDANFQTTINLR